MKDFSMFEYALKIAAESSAVVEELGEIHHISRRDFDERETVLFQTQVPCLEYVSLLIENAVLLRTNRSGRVYAGFEKLSRMEAVADRYLRMADVSERVYVFGEPDWRPPRHPNMRLIELPAGLKLSREWFVIVDSPTLKIALVALDKDGFDLPVLEERRFHAIKTQNPKLVALLSAAAENLIDAFLRI